MRNKKDWKFYLGIVLFIYSFIPYIISSLLPFWGMSVEKLLTIITTLIISAEIAFIISIVLLGKIFVEKFQEKLKKLFRRKGPPKPISKTRHYFGIILLLLSFVPCVLIDIFLCLDYPQTEKQHTTILIGILSGYTLFIIAFYILGTNFWSRLKKLFQWPGEDLKEK